MQFPSFPSEEEELSQARRCMIAIYEHEIAVTHGPMTVEYAAFYYQAALLEIHSNQQAYNKISLVARKMQ